jgi:CRISPR-associated protein Cmr6
MKTKVWDYTAPNLGLLFYKRVYSEPDIKKLIQFDNNVLKIDIDARAKTSDFDKYYRALVNFKTDDGYTQIENPAATHCFSLKTFYPGLLLGSGYTHDSGAKGDFKIGFFFDHTTGQPVLPGSSVKGVLRSIFELDTNERGRKTTGLKSAEAVNFFIKEAKVECPEVNVSDTKALMQEIFGTQDQPGNDVFFDAVIDIKKSGSKKIVSTDFITPHKHNGTPRRPELDQFSNPTPLMFLKVMPEIYFEFRFNLTNSSIIGARLKVEFFKAIITTLGIGAKTNVGYGQFEQ